MRRETLFPINGNEEIVTRNGCDTIALKADKQKAIQPMPDAQRMISYWNKQAGIPDNKLVVFKIYNTKQAYKSATVVIRGMNSLYDGQFFNSKYTVAPIIGRYTPHQIRVSLTKIRRPITVKGFCTILDAYLESVKRQKKISLYNFMFGNSKGPEAAHFGSPFVKQLYKLLTGRTEQRTYDNPGKWADHYKYVYWFLEETVGHAWEDQLDDMRKEDFAERFYSKQMNLINEVERSYIEHEPSKWIMHEPFIKEANDSWRDSDPPLFYFLSDKFFEFMNKYSQKSDF